MDLRRVSRIIDCAESDAIENEGRSAPSETYRAELLMKTGLWTWGQQYKRVPKSSRQNAPHICHNDMAIEQKHEVGNTAIEPKKVKYLHDHTDLASKTAERWKVAKRQYRAEVPCERFEAEWHRLDLDKVKNPMDLAEKTKLMQVEGLDRARKGRQTWRQIRSNRDIQFQKEYKRHLVRINKASRAHKEIYGAAFDWQKIFQDARNMLIRGMEYDRKRTRISTWKLGQKMIELDNQVEEAFKDHVLHRGFPDYTKMSFEDIQGAILDFSTPGLPNLTTFKHLYRLLELNAHFTRDQIETLQERKMRYKENQRLAKVRERARNAE